MVRIGGPKQRAMDAEEKATRRAHILATARQLYLASGRQLPTVATIADASGLAKGTVYLYFRTKEAIFMALLGEAFADTLGQIHAAFAGQHHTDPARVFVEHFIAAIDAHPDMLSLDAMTYSVLEQNLDEASLRDFKTSLTNGLVAVGTVLDQSLNLPNGQGVSLLLRTYALTRGLWQTLDHSAGHCPFIDDPFFAPIRPDFRTELPIALGQLWRGALV
ncbi:TetR/AcrR family transcriptional regulator [Burkholderiaceae bacterium DAT-1]|nr:TetR/AcrR family transcriptional regulator [Burkholderiaceae bacterium DAT-1]